MNETAHEVDLKLGSAVFFYGFYSYTIYVSQKNLYLCSLYIG